MTAPKVRLFDTVAPRGALGGTWLDAGPGSDPGWNAYDRRSRTWAVRHLLRGESRAGPVLDLGCAIGAWAPFWRAEGFPTPLGLDLSERAVVGEISCCADATALPFAAASVQTILCVDMLVHILDPDRQAQVLREVARVLRPGGVVVLSVPSVLGYRRGRRRLVLRDSVYMTLADARALVRQAGLQGEAERGVHFLESGWWLWRWLPRTLRYRVGLPLADRLCQRAYRTGARVLFLKARKP